MRSIDLLLAVMLITNQAGAFNAFRAARIDQRPGAQIPFTAHFRDETGQSTTLTELSAGKPMVLAPVLHNCPNICGVTLGGLGDAIANQSYVAGKDFVIVAFGIDPNERTKQALTSLQKLKKSYPRLSDDSVHALTGRKDDIAAVTQALGYRYAFDKRIGQYAHVAAVAVVTANGRLTRWLYGISPDPGDLKLALTEAGDGSIGDWGDQLVLLCYHYDPKTGRYGSIIWSLLRIAAGLVLAALFGGIGISLWRERRKSSRSRA